MAIALDNLTDTLYAASASSSTVLVISGTNSTVEGTVGVGSQPYAVAFNYFNREIYVANELSNNVSVINTTTNRVVASVPAGFEPRGVVCDYLTGNVYVSNLNSKNVTVISGITNRTVTSVYIGGNGPFGLAFDPFANTIYVANQGAGNVTVISGSSNTITAYITGMGWPYTATFDPNNREVYVVDYINSVVYAINTSTNSIVATIVIDYNGGTSDPWGEALDTLNGELYVDSTISPDLFVISTASDTLAATLEISGGLGMGFDPQSGYIYLTSSGGTGVFAPVPSLPWISSFAPSHSPVSIGSTAWLNVSASGGSSANTYDYTGLPLGCLSSNTSSLACAPILEGNYTVVTTVSDNFGARSDSIILSVSRPTLSVQPSNSSPEVGQSIWLNASVSDDVPPYTYLYLALPPGCATANTSSLVCTPTKVGSYTVRVFANDSIGNSVNATTSLTVKLFPITSFVANPPSIIVGSTTSLDVSASGGSGALSYRYTGLPPGCTTSNTATLACTPTKVGSDSIRVFVNDSGGNSVNATTPLTVKLFPITSFFATPSTVDVGTTTTLSVSTTGGSGALSYRYTNLPPGCTTSNTPTLSCTPTAAGPHPFMIWVTVNDTGGNSNSTSTNLTVNAPPSVSVSANPSQTDALAPVTFSATVSGGTGPYQYAWLFGNGATVGGQSVSHTFGSSGNFTVRVYANDTFGLSATNTYMITVYPALTVTLNVSSATPLLGQTVAFVTNATGGLGPYNYTYSGFPPGCVSENKPAIGCLPTQADFYNVTVDVRDQNGVTTTASASVHVIFDFNVIVPTNTSAGSPFTISVNTNETFSGGTAFVPSGGFGAFTYNYTGLPPGCMSQDAASITCTPTQVGAYHITISVHDQAGDHQAHTVVVNVVPAKSPGFGLSSYTSGTTGYALFGGIAAVVAIAVTLLAFRSRRKKKSPESSAVAPAAPSPPSPPT